VLDPPPEDEGELNVNAAYICLRSGVENVFASCGVADRGVTEGKQEIGCAK
jgi:hypothetical protein